MFIRGGLVGVALLVLAEALLVYRTFAIAKPVVSYGNGGDRRALIVGAIGLGAIATVLTVTLALAGS